LGEDETPYISHYKLKFVAICGGTGQQSELADTLIISSERLTVNAVSINVRNLRVVHKLIRKYDKSYS